MPPTTPPTKASTFVLRFVLVWKVSPPWPVGTLMDGTLNKGTLRLNVLPFGVNATVTPRALNGIPVSTVRVTNIAGAWKSLTE